MKKKKYYGGGMTSKMYEYGGSVDPFSSKNPEGVPITNAQERTQKMAMGGMIDDSEKKTLKKHSSHHSKKHMDEMKKDMDKGSSFTKAHKKALKKVGK